MSILHSLNYCLSLLPHSYLLQHHVLEERDMIKLGKQKLKVREIVVGKNKGENEPNFDQIKVSMGVYEKNNLVCNSQSKQTGQIGPSFSSERSRPLVEERDQVETQNCEKLCRICLDPGECDNPLIVPCKCYGSVRYIHLRCLRAWLAKRIKLSKGKYCTTLDWEPLSCELCKSFFKYRIFLDNQRFYTVEIPKPPKPYIVLEVAKKNANNNTRTFKFVSFADKNTISLGRKKDIDAKISDDVSVSRWHATLTFDGRANRVLLSDNGSKFGTLVLLRHNLLVRPHFHKLELQIGAQLFQFSSIREATSLQIPDFDNSDNYLNMQADQSEVSDDESIDEEEGQNQHMENIASPEVNHSPRGQTDPVRERSLELIPVNSQQ